MPPADRSDDDQGIQLPAKTPGRRDHAGDDDDDFDDVRIDAPPENPTLAIVSHWGGMFTWIILPLILYLVEKDKRSFTAAHAREALNYQINSMLHVLLSLPLACLMFVDLWLILVWFGVAILFGFVELLLVTLATIAAARGRRYRYPLMIPFIPTPSEEPNPYADRD